MTVLVNLLPDTRQAKLRDRRRRQLAGGVAFGIWAVCGGVVVLLVLYTTSQSLLIGSLTKKISTKESQLAGTSGLVDALTAQQHLSALPGLYSQRVYLTKFFTAYQQASPPDVKLTSLAIDASNALSVNGTANTYASVAKLARALEAENVTLGSGASADADPYFTNVAIQSVSKSNNQISFTLNATVSAKVTSGN